MSHYECKYCLGRCTCMDPRDTDPIPDDKLLVLDRDTAIQLCGALRDSLGWYIEYNLTNAGLERKLKAYVEELAGCIIEVTDGVGDLSTPAPPSPDWIYRYFLSTQLSRLRKLKQADEPKLRVLLEKVIIDFVDGREREDLEATIRDGLKDVNLETLRSISELVEKATPARKA